MMAWFIWGVITGVTLVMLWLLGPEWRKMLTFNERSWR